MAQNRAGDGKVEFGWDAAAGRVWVKPEEVTVGAGKKIKFKPDDNQVEWEVTVAGESPFEDGAKAVKGKKEKDKEVRKAKGTKTDFKYTIVYDGHELDPILVIEFDR